MDINEMLMEELGAKNPKMKALLQAMQQQSPEEAAAEENTRSKLRQHNKKLMLALKREISKNKTMLQENKVLQDNTQFLEGINDELSAALGACPECWGTISHCDICNGKGRPGAFPVNRKAFIKYMMPVIKNTSWIQQVFTAPSNEKKQH